MLNERGDGFLEVVVSLDAHEIDGHALEQFLGRLALAFCLAGECFAESRIAGINEECFSGFGIFKFYEARGREFHFARVNDRDRKHVVALTENLECVLETFVQEVARGFRIWPAYSSATCVFVPWCCGLK